MKLDGKVAIVTGSGRGIGRVIAITLAKVGADVVITSRNLNQIKETRDEVRKLGCRSIAIQGDITIEKDVKSLIDKTLKEFGKIDILVNNAGIAGPMTEVVSMDLEGWRKTLDINITGTMLPTREALKYMIERKSGNIIIISSNAGQRGLATRSPYVSSKWAQIGFAQCLAHEVTKYNIRVNTVCPGAVKGERIKKYIQQRAKIFNTSFEEGMKSVANDALMKRLITPEEVAKVVLFFASDASSGITGQTLNVCGGTVLH